MHELNSLIVSCGKDNFKIQYIDENAWYPVSINPTKIPQLKYIFAYQKSPVAAITHVAQIKNITPIIGSSKYKITFNAPEQIRTVPMGRDQRNVPQNPRYARYKKVIGALNMDAIF